MAVGACGKRDGTFEHCGWSNQGMHQEADCRESDKGIYEEPRHNAVNVRMVDSLHGHV